MMDSDQALPGCDEAEEARPEGHGLRRGILFGLLFASPFWIGLAYTIWRLVR